MELSKEQIDIAVDWWTKAIQKPKFDNGDSSMAGGMGMMIAEMTKINVTDIQLQIFADHLRSLITRDDFIESSLGCDYHPCPTLMEAMDEASIPSTQAPWKTQMSFRDGKVMVACGYAAPFQQLYPVIEKKKYE